MTDTKIHKTKKAIFSTFMIIGMIIFGLSIQSFAAVNKNIALPGGVTAFTQTTASIHKALPVTAIVKVRRTGSDNDYGQRYVRFRLISPTGAVKTVYRSIGQSYETVMLSLPAANGSQLIRTWKVQLRNMEPGSNAEVNKSLIGDVRFTSTGKKTAYISSPAKFGLVQSQIVSKNIGMPFTGNLTIQANWDTDEISVQNYKLKFALYKGNKRLAYDTGYSRDSIIVGISNSQRMKISYRVKASDFNRPGAWRVKVYGSTLGKVKNIKLKMKISDGVY
jgi:hypothetical protein